VNEFRWVLKDDGSHDKYQVEYFGKERDAENDDRLEED
jgi:hypothetical protein